MKNKLILCSVVFIVTIATAKAQDSLKMKKHNNELGIDFTPFVKFYLDFNQNSSYYYSPSYFLTYRYHFRKSNIRAAIGGAYSITEMPSLILNDSKTYTSLHKSINFRVGYEFYENISKRWQVFYGIDFRPGYSHDRDDMMFSQSYYANGSDTKTTYYGVAPLLGFRLKINSRLSILTESSFQFNMIRSEKYNYFTPLDNLHPPIPNSDTQKVKTVGTTFNFPISVTLTADI